MFYFYPNYDLGRGEVMRKELCFEVDFTWTFLLEQMKKRKQTMNSYSNPSSFDGTSFDCIHAKIKVIYPKYSKHWPYIVAHTIDCVYSKMLNHGVNPGVFSYFSSLYPATYIELYVC